MIKFDFFDNDPYTGINIFEDGEIKKHLTVAGTWDRFEDFLMVQQYPKTLDQAVSLVNNFSKGL